MPPDDPQVEEIETRSFLEAIYHRYGYDLREYQAGSMRRRVQVALTKSGLPHLGELQHQVLVDVDLFTNVLEDLTVRVSEMFRDPAFYQVVRARVVPLLRTYPLLNVWLSGCSAGEEAYSAAVLLTEEGIYDRTQIYATDISARALDQAKQGVYPVEHLAATTSNYKAAGGRGDFQDYYVAAYDHLAVRESLRRKILFFQHNLVSDQVFGQMQVIFCRNVLIYFQRPLRQRVLRMFTDSLCPGGFLCLGSSERLTGADAAGFSEFDAHQRIYRYEG